MEWMASDHIVQVSGWPVNGRLLDGGWWTVGGYGILSIGCRQCRGGGRHSSDGGLKRGMLRCGSHGRIVF